MTPRMYFLRSMYEGVDDQWLAEYALDRCHDQLPQPESLDRFVRAARLRPQGWAAAARNAVCQLTGATDRTKRL